MAPSSVVHTAEWPEKAEPTAMQCTAVVQANLNGSPSVMEDVVHDSPPSEVRMIA
jgi:hypothetical protein